MSSRPLLGYSCVSIKPSLLIRGTVRVSGFSFVFSLAPRLHSSQALLYFSFCFFFFNDTPPTEISPLPLHAALPISGGAGPRGARRPPAGGAGRGAAAASPPATAAPTHGGSAPPPSARRSSGGAPRPSVRARRSP